MCEERRRDRVEDRLDSSVEVFDLGVERDPTAGDVDQRAFRAAGRGQRIAKPEARRDRDLATGRQPAELRSESGRVRCHTRCVTGSQPRCGPSSHPCERDAADATLRPVRRPLWGPRSRLPRARLGRPSPRRSGRTSRAGVADDDPVDSPRSRSTREHASVGTGPRPTTRCPRHRPRGLHRSW